jgi:hypothetical protein
MGIRGPEDGTGSFPKACAAGCKLNDGTSDLVVVSPEFKMTEEFAA